ncbi:MAG: hypothetical protein QM758_11485 [Armatimonas sp.]
MEMLSDEDYFDSYSDSADDEPDSLPAQDTEGGPATNPIFDSALARLFAESMEAGLPPKPLRPVLEQGFWQPASPPSRATQAEALAKGRSFGGKELKWSALPPEAQVASFAAMEHGHSGALPAQECLSALLAEGHIEAVLLRFQGQWYGFVAEQFPALYAYVIEKATERDIASKEAWRLQLLTGAGRLEEFLSMPVCYPKDLPTDYGILGKGMGTAQSQVICINTPGFARGYLSGKKSGTMREALAALAERTDYDGIQFNTTATGDSCFHTVGPNFARAVLDGTDRRRAPRCPAESIHLFSYAHYLTRPFSDLKDYGKKEVEEALEGARFLLSAIPPDAETLPREAVQSLLGAFYLRCKPEYAHYRWLEGFIRRCERALTARWRVGVF